MALPLLRLSTCLIELQTKPSCTTAVGGVWSDAASYHKGHINRVTTSRHVVQALPRDTFDKGHHRTGILCSLPFLLVGVTHVLLLHFVAACLVPVACRICCFYAIHIVPSAKCAEIPILDFMILLFVYGFKCTPSVLKRVYF
jgi:hypothetical protein